MMTRRTHTALLILLTLTWMFVGCGRDEFGAPSRSSGGDIVEPEEPEDPNVSDPIQGGGNGVPVDQPGAQDISFGELSAFDIYRASVGSSPENANVAVNPIGISQAFIALHMAASGETKEILGKQISYDADNTYEAFANFNDSARRESDISVSGVWVDEQFALEQTYVNDVGMLLDLPVRTLSFAPTDDARSQINTFIRNETDGFLGDTIAPRAIEPGTFVIANAHLYDSAWTFDFDADRTERVSFGNGEADIMFRTTEYLHYDSPALAAVVVPMENDLVGIFIAPNEGELSSLEAEIDLDYILELRNTMTLEVIDLGLPRFDFTHSFRLSEVAEDIDSQFLFDDGTFEDLSPGIAMGDVFQETRIVVNETGLSSDGDTTDLGTDPVTARSLILNRPMLFIVFDTTNDAVRTIGRIVTP